MTQPCKKVHLRTRPNKAKDRLSYYLDFYPMYRDQSTMETVRHRSIDITIYANPKNQREKLYNEKMAEKAEMVRCRVYESIVNERYDIFDREKMKGDFLAYFKRLAAKRNKKWEQVYLYFTDFMHGTCTFADITVELCGKFREYLLTTRHSITGASGCTSTPPPTTGPRSATRCTSPTAKSASRTIPTAFWKR